jgi:hypothetical protein
MKIYGGRWMCDLFSLNFAGPSYNTIRCENRKGIQFIAGKHAIIFQCVASIYREAKKPHELIGLVPVFLAKDEMKVKSRIA